MQLLSTANSMIICQQQQQQLICTMHCLTYMMAYQAGNASPAWT